MSGRMINETAGESKVAWRRGAAKVGTHAWLVVSGVLKRTPEK